MTDFQLTTKIEHYEHMLRVCDRIRTRKRQIRSTAETMRNPNLHPVHKLELAKVLEIKKAMTQLMEEYVK